MPTGLVGQNDVNRVSRELDGLNDFFISAAARSPGAPVKPPRITYLLEQLARDNNFNLLQAEHRVELKNKIDSLSSAPLIHISFAIEPSPRVIDTILGWLRSNIHPNLLLQIGLQPTIAAGCILRTPSKIFDMSLRSHVQKQESYLVGLIHGAASGKKR